MIDRDHDLSLVRQAKVLNFSRGGVYYRPRPVSPEASQSWGGSTNCIWNIRSPEAGCWATFSVVAAFRLAAAIAIRDGSRSAILWPQDLSASVARRESREAEPALATDITYISPAPAFAP
ncbi:hypothetical protein CCR94_03755 [Rhodoblastus sphagnicola]|uniref:Uncharacterized protein n=1 Tax=Rhodoblastus sphagnicola TaxID=333368 RepID=A0A2S6NDN6_9HYPH|nr:hypothetical protein CCR94_03755 [Rhodoblastus sphagnicola]